MPAVTVRTSNLLIMVLILSLSKVLRVQTYLRKCDVIRSEAFSSDVSFHATPFTRLNQIDRSSYAGLQSRFSTRRDIFPCGSGSICNGANFTAFSFYRFFSPADVNSTGGSATIAEFIRSLKHNISSLSEKIKGTLIIAPGEGINGQFVVPVEFIDDFQFIMSHCEHPQLGWLSGIDFNIGETSWYDYDEYGNPLSNASNEGGNITRNSVFPFKKLIIREKETILQDGLGDQRGEFNWTDAGVELSPAEWHRELADVNATTSIQATDGDGPILLDCRNWYESDIGKFEGAVPLSTNQFSESWEALDALLPPDKSRRILTYCTGGIRCVKVNAYLKQKLGYHNIARLEKGIIAYESWYTSAQAVELPMRPKNLFKGKNFLFDRRRLQGSRTHAFSASTKSSESAEDSNSGGDLDAIDRDS